MVTTGDKWCGRFMQHLHDAQWGLKNGSLHDTAAWYADSFKAVVAASEDLDACERQIAGDIRLQEALRLLPNWFRISQGQGAMERQCPTDRWTHPAKYWECCNWLVKDLTAGSHQLRVVLDVG